MVCFQSEQAAEGVYGKGTDNSELRDKLIGALIGLARATDGNEDLVSSSTDKVVIEGLLAAVASVSCDKEAITGLIARVQEEKRRLVPNCFGCAAPCGRTGDYDMQELWTADEDVRSLKSLILLSIRGMAEYACHASAPGFDDKDVIRFIYKALFVIGMDQGADELLPVVSEAGEVSFKCMTMPDNDDSYSGRL